MSKSVTLQDVARLAGVSAKTVSRVINKESHVRPEKRQAVEEAVNALGYRPHFAARALASSRSYLICAISPWLESTYFQEWHLQLIRASKACGHHLVIEELNLSAPDAVLELKSSLAAMRCDKAILTSPFADDPTIIKLLNKMGVDYVRMSPNTQPELSDSVFVDQAQGMRLVAEHLWSLGHRRFAIVADPHPQAPMNRSFLLTQLLLELGAEPENIIYLPLNYRVGGLKAGHECAQAIQQSPIRPTAVFAYADEVAAGIVNHALENGIRIPDELSVVGFDDFYIAQMVWPPLTTIKVSLDEVARQAVSLLLNPGDGKQARHIVCPVELIVRNSTAAPASSGR